MVIFSFENFKSVISKVEINTLQTFIKVVYVANFYQHLRDFNKFSIF